MKFMKVDWCQRVRRSISRLWACLVRTSAISLTSSHGNWIRRSRRSLPFLFVNLRLGLKPKFQVAVGPRKTGDSPSEGPCDLAYHYENRDVGYWHETDLPGRPDDVRFQGKNGSSRPTTKMTCLTRMRSPVGSEIVGL
jgi:hypothetical protein